MKILFSIAFLLLSACSKPYIDPAFQPLVNQWNNTYPNKIVNVPIYFGAMPNPNWVGYWDGVEVVIEPNFWNGTTDGGKKEVLFHELGHAMFGYGHDWNCINASNPNDVEECEVSDDTSASVSSYPYIPRSIMYPYVFGMDSIWDAFQNYYINQLGSCNTCTNFTNGGPDMKYQTLKTLRRID